MSLVLSRKQFEVIYLYPPTGEKITITVISPARVKLAIDAPEDVLITREELEHE